MTPPTRSHAHKDHAKSKRTAKNKSIYTENTENTEKKENKEESESNANSWLLSVFSVFSVVQSFYAPALLSCFR